MNIKKRTSFVQTYLPQLSRLKRLSLSRDVVLIHAPGFEDRTLSVLDLVNSKSGTKGILLDYRPYVEGNRLEEVKRGLQEMGIVIKEEDVIIYNRFEPDDFETRLRDHLVRLEARGVVVDISTMSKLAIMQVLNVCWNLDLEVQIIYSEARTYGPTKPEFDAARREKKIHQPSLQVYTGIHGVVRVPSLSSVAMQGQPTAALVFMSLNDALTQVLLNSVYPSRLFLINGQPPKLRWREHATAWIHDQVRREWESDNPVEYQPNAKDPLPKRFVSTLHYQETVSLLLDLYWTLSTHYRILLAPAGSKMQAVGCFLVKALHPDIHIEYPSPEGFLPVYSSKIGRKWLLDIGRISDILAKISRAERRHFLEIQI